MRPILQQQLPVYAAALWWGSLSAIGFLAVPMLFAHLPTASMAGQVAAKLFSAMTWVSLACCFVLIFCFRPARDGQEEASTSASPASPDASWALALTGWILAGAIVALLSEFGIAPRIIARENLALWHRIGTAMYAAQWLCASVVMWKLASRIQRPR
ncbi:DUF4149 domain-containing protein [Lampropedia puyangensis]|uniref:DUF4149 domain-containing protein n=1 Tax=Lampropedia puyangensis TaxID=1330072 RepID=A0A4S8F0X6_9BURK|nr:DUF4149 domain-containing protein [Lampropedia puyangensis]THU00607.1 DUF4149 domain-containing protein [Lampropedia puyangensis]